MTLPEAVSRFFEAERTEDAALLSRAFAPDATVRDEGRIHVGAQEIFSWWRAAKVRYHHRSRPLSARDHPGGVVVTAEVTGDFPGSPARLTFDFTVEAGAIRALEIGA